MDSLSGSSSAQASATNTVMLKKTLDFQQETTAKLLAGATQGGGTESALRTGTIHAQGKGQQVDTTV